MLLRGCVHLFFKQERAYYITACLALRRVLCRSIASRASTSTSPSRRLPRHCSTRPRAACPTSSAPRFTTTTRTRSSTAWSTMSASPLTLRRVEIKERPVRHIGDGMGDIRRYRRGAGQQPLDALLDRDRGVRSQGDEPGLALGAHGRGVIARRAT